MVKTLNLGFVDKRAGGAGPVVVGFQTWIFGFQILDFFLLGDLNLGNFDQDLVVVLHQWWRLVEFGFLG